MSERVCPWWMGYWLVNPLRRFVHNPRRILAPLVAPGMTVLEVGPAMGFFTLYLAERVGDRGKVVCVDVQERMLRALQRRARAARLADRIVARVGTPASLDIDEFDGTFSFVLAFYVVHEVADAPRFFDEISRAMNQGSSCLVAEPRGHVSAAQFEQTLRLAANSGLRMVGSPPIAWSRTALLRKPG